MQSQRGNFLLQALLALACIFAFIPFFANTIAARDTNERMFAATGQIEQAQAAARIFIRENANALPYDKTVIAGNQFADTLEAYGLPLGFVPRTALGQDIALVINKTATDITAHLEVTGGDLSAIARAELIRRIGFYATPFGDAIRVGIALENIYSDVVRRNEPDTDNNGFLTNLDMGGNTFNNAGTAIARQGDFATGEFKTLSIIGFENGRRVRNSIAAISANKAVFQTKSGEAALSITRGVLSADEINAKTIAKFGDTGNFTSNSASVYDFAMTAGRTGFSGPDKWNVRGNLVSDRVTFSVERLDVDSFVNASRGQDVYITPDDLEYNSRSGIDAGVLIASNITLRDQTSAALANGESGAVVVDIRPAGTSVLPDVLLETIDNNAFSIIARPGANDDKMQNCRTIISDLNASYNQRSLAQYIICQYVYWQRLEKRIDIKECLLSGRGGCV